MKKLILAAMLAASAVSAHATSWFQFEAGAGWAYVETYPDGTWYQQGLPHKLDMTPPVLTLGVTGPLYQAENWGVDYHVDLVYVSRISAWSLAVADSDYNPATHTVTNLRNVSSFSGSGNELGISATVEPYYVYDGWKFGVQGGLYAYRQTWTEAVFGPNGAVQVQHSPSVQVTWTAGVSVGKGPWSVNYQYLPDKAPWNPYPGIAEKTHMVTVKYVF